MAILRYSGQILTIPEKLDITPASLARTKMIELPGNGLSLMA
jgi:hypothetical protein